MTTTYIETHHHQGALDHESDGSRSLFAIVRRWRTEFARWAEARQKYHQTVTELSALTDRELNDIGIARFQIREVARGEIANHDRLR